MTNVGQLISFIDSSGVAKAFFEQLATRVKNYRTTTVDHAVRLIGRDRREVVEMFKQMEELGLGSFIVGRRTGVSRFEWSVGMVETAQAALGGKDDIAIEPLESSELELEEFPEEEDSESMQHSFVLRRDLTVSLNLPLDLNTQEAERLSKFILTLPICG